MTDLDFDPGDPVDPFADVSGRYGAPMGRADFGSLAILERLEKGLPVDVTHQHAKEDTSEPAYDSGGAYWGLPDNVHAVHFGASRIYVRAADAVEAIKLVAETI